MPESPDNQPLHPGFRDRQALTFLLKEIQRRFPSRDKREIHAALEQALAEIAPSLDRSRLRAKMIRILRDSMN
jgi:hypothetical protein